MKKKEGGATGDVSSTETLAGAFTGYLFTFFSVVFVLLINSIVLREIWQ